MIPTAIVLAGVAMSIAGWRAWLKTPEGRIHHTEKLLAQLEGAFWDLEFAMHEATVAVEEWWKAITA